MKIKGLSSKTINRVAEIHYHELPGFLSEIGEEFLKNFYMVSLEIPEMFTVVVEHNGEVIGFASASVSTKGFNKKILFKAPFFFGWFILKRIVVKPALFIKAIKVFFYPGFTHDYPELFSIATDKKHRRVGVGKILFDEVIAEFKKRGVQDFLIGVYEKLPANNFYRKIGCEFYKRFDFLDEKMNYYIFRIYGNNKKS